MAKKYENVPEVPFKFTISDNAVLGLCTLKENDNPEYPNYEYVRIDEYNHKIYFNKQQILDTLNLKIWIIENEDTEETDSEVESYVTVDYDDPIKS